MGKRFAVTPLKTPTTILQVRTVCLSHVATSKSPYECPIVKFLQTLRFTLISACNSVRRNVVEKNCTRFMSRRSFRES
jgi:hypothetical protein